ncbi:MAG: diaminopimelate epimerase [Desulfobulbaceae bacterium]|nr:diaminopimelate epimerase [Desulfobulbaceae bacterium]HIJ79782.1 diaminopimelate epimerase [Deltaproteobacteria bacterium]
MAVNFPVDFTKMSGTGNDFIVIDHRQPFLSKAEMPAFAKAVCRRKFSAGADGLILIENCDDADFRWQFLNGDGSFAEMCGNGARCAARFAHAKGIAQAKMRFATMAGIIEAEVIGASVRLKMTEPNGLALDNVLGVDEQDVVVHSLNTGVPHAVIFMDDIAAAPVFEWGRLVRFHDHFQPAGTNVNFVQVLADGSVVCRTYERGVEEETMACGTGAVAAAIIAGLKGYVQAPVAVTTSGGDRLTIHFKIAAGRPMDVYLEGPANFIYDGRLHEEAVRSK